jgi:hypothetical protein
MAMAPDLVPTASAPLAGLTREANQGCRDGQAPQIVTSSRSQPPPPDCHPVGGPTSQGEGQRRGACHSAYAPVLLGAALLLWPAAFNGYPLVFSDTGTYLSQAVHRYLGWDRPIFYSLFMLPLHLTLTTWPVIVAQALLASYTLHLLRRVLLPAVSAWWLVPLAGALTIATTLPWLASQLTPDLFTGLMVLTLGLLLFAASSLSKGEYIWLGGCSAFMIAMHQSHLPLLLLVVPLLLPLRAWLGPGGLRDTLRMLAAPALACVALIDVNLAGHHRAALSPFGNVFLLARVIYDGPGMDELVRDCPRMQWRLCPYLAQFPPAADDFLWQADGPVVRAGGAKLLSGEANAIIAAAVVAEPIRELRAVLGNTAQQLTEFATGDGFEAWPNTVTPWILRDFPRFEADTYLASRQTKSVLLVPGWLITLHRVVELLGVAVCTALLPVALRRRHRVGGFLALILLILPANALIAGALSGPHDRYQSRVMWLPTLLAALAIPALAVPALTQSARRPARPSAGQSASQSTRQQDPPQSAQSAPRQPRPHIAPSAKPFPRRALRALRWIFRTTNRLLRPVSRPPYPVPSPNRTTTLRNSAAMSESRRS